jgi:hypothetical protein
MNRKPVAAFADQKTYGLLRFESTTDAAGCRK